MNAIVIEHLTKEYKDVIAVQDLNVGIPEGILFTLLGVNGAGKTTTIKMLSGLTKPTSGDACLLGKHIVQDHEHLKSIIALSPQETTVAPNLSVKENLELMAGVHGFTKEKTARRVHEMMEQFSLENIQHKRAKKLSGGWMRRLSIAMALISQPRILFLDEPTLGLDVLARNELWTIIRSLKGQVTIILTTHYMEEAQALSDEIGIMKAGKLRFHGNFAQLKKQTGCETMEEAFIRIVQEDVL